VLNGIEFVDAVADTRKATVDAVFATYCQWKRNSRFLYVQPDTDGPGPLLPKDGDQGRRRHELPGERTIQTGENFEPTS